MEKKKIIIPVVTIAVIGAVGGTGYYYRDNVIDVATEAFDVVAEKIPFLQSGKSDDKVYVEKVSKNLFHHVIRICLQGSQFKCN